MHLTLQGTPVTRRSLAARYAPCERPCDHDPTPESTPRYLAELMQKQLGQPVVLEPRLGAVVICHAFRAVMLA